MINPSDIPRIKAQCAADLRSISASGSLPADIQRERIELLAELLDAYETANTNFTRLVTAIKEGNEAGLIDDGTAGYLLLSLATVVKSEEG